MDSTTVAIISAPLYSSAAIVPQKDRQRGHCRILPDTLAIASPKPRFTMSVAAIITGSAIHIHTITLCYRKSYKVIANKLPSANLTIRCFNIVHGVALSDCNACGCSRRSHRN